LIGSKGLSILYFTRSSTGPAATPEADRLVAAVELARPLSCGLDDTPVTIEDERLDEGLEGGAGEPVPGEETEPPPWPVRWVGQVEEVVLLRRLATPFFVPRRSSGPRKPSESCGEVVRPSWPSSRRVRSKKKILEL
jgi:hypothetical protein